MLKKKSFINCTSFVVFIQIVPLYQSHEHSCCLYVGCIVVDVFSKEPACIPVLLDMFQVNVSQ